MMSGLLFAAAQLVGHLVAFAGHAHLLKHFGDALVDGMLVFPAGGLEHEGQVGLHGAVGEELEILKHDAHASAQGRHVFALDVAHVVAQHGGFFGLLQVEFGIEGLEQRGLAGAHLADKVDELAGVQLKVDALEHVEFLLRHAGRAVSDEWLLLFHDGLVFFPGG
jgi:hypothetical protein